MKLFFLLALALFSSAAWAIPEISYTITPVKNDPNAFFIEMTFRGSASGKTMLSIPFETGLYRPQDHISILTILKSRKHYKAQDSGRYVIEHLPNATLTVRYTITNTIKDSSPTIDEVYASMLTDKYFYIIGHSLWIVPFDSTHKDYNISLNWKNFPSNWKHLNSYGSNKLIQQLKLSLDDFQNAIYMGGDIRVYQLMINKRPLYFGIRGSWTFTDQKILDIIKRTVEAQRSFWNDYNVNAYTIGLIPMKYETENDRSINGRGLKNTFVTVGTNTKAFGLNDLFFLYNHELMHHWFGTIIKNGTPENAYKWFSEGFNDYFAHVAMEEGGLFGPSEFKDRINYIIKLYQSDSTNQWPNEKLEKDYWASSKINILPYQRGLIFALYLDEAIKKQTSGKLALKNVILQLLAEARLQKKGFSLPWFLSVLRKITGQDYREQIEEYITKGTFIPINEWQKVSTKMALVQSEVFDLGFTIDKSAMSLNAKITTIQEGSNVQKAGLQIGDVIAGFSSSLKPNEITTVTVKRGEEKIRFQYLPSRKIWTPQLQ